VVLLGVEGFDETTCFEYHRELELLRFDMNLDGYMMRAVSQRGREWGRVARDAVAGGFSLMTLGAESARMYRKSPHVKSVEILMVTSSAGDVRMLFAPAEKASRLIGAMSKMSEELSFDCGECSYRDVCDEVEGLRSMRGTLRSEKKMI
jgi:CO dehydrogenase/acetyl-CoA synthase beta subunit